MILYRKRKQYSDELRVIDLALNRFSKENEKRYSQAVANPANRKYLEQIESAMEVNSGVKNNEGWFIFNPYYIIHWIERREKVLKLIEKAKRNGNLGGAINH